LKGARHSGPDLDIAKTPAADAGQLTDAPFDDKNWIFEDKYDGFRMVAVTKGGKVTPYSQNDASGEIIRKVRRRR
jgi:hypothetical protein